MEPEWVKKLHAHQTKEFSFFPHSYTPLDPERAWTPPPVEITLEPGETSSKESADTEPHSWLQNISFTVGGVTIGAAAMFGWMSATAPAPLQCPLPTPTTQAAATTQTVTPTTSSTTQTPASTTPATSTSAGTAATSNPDTSGAPTTR